MRAVERVSQLSVGDVVLTGSAFYRVTDAEFVGKFRGRVWDGDAWGAVRDVPLPSPTHPAHVVTEAPRLFPLPAPDGGEDVPAGGWLVCSVWGCGDRQPDADVRGEGVSLGADCRHIDCVGVYRDMV